MLKGEPLELRQLSDDLRRRLDQEPATFTIEYVARRLDCAAGLWTVELDLDDGWLRKVHRRHRNIGTEALEELAAGRTLESARRPDHEAQE